jgi:hypothetical protein
MSWLGGTVQRWIALVGLAFTLAGIGTLVSKAGRDWAWLVLVGLALLVVSLGWTARDEHKLRVGAEEATHQPPGGGVPMYAPVEYQVSALRQVIKRLSEGMDEFGFFELTETLKNLPRRGADPVYEPLSGLSCDEGLARLVELGELESLGSNSWRIVKG